MSFVIIIWQKSNILTILKWNNIKTVGNLLQNSYQKSKWNSDKTTIALLVVLQNSVPILLILQLNISDDVNNTKNLW